MAMMAETWVMTVMAMIVTPDEPGVEAGGVEE